MKLRYGTGKIILDYNKPASVIVVRFRGNPYLKAEEGIVISKVKNVITFTGQEIEGNFCKYFGYFKVLSCSVDGINLAVKTMNIHLSELIDEKSEDITTKSEELKNTYTHLRKFKGYQFSEKRGRASAVATTSGTATTTSGGY